MLISDDPPGWTSDNHKGPPTFPRPCSSFPPTQPSSAPFITCQTLETLSHSMSCKAITPQGQCKLQPEAQSRFCSMHEMQQSKSFVPRRQPSMTERLLIISCAPKTEDIQAFVARVPCHSREVRISVSCPILTTPYLCLTYSTYASQRPGRHPTCQAARASGMASPQSSSLDPRRSLSPRT